MISYKYNIYHSKKTKYLDKMLRECCFVWNHALALQRRYYKLFGKYISVGPNWKARVIPAIVISGFLAFVSKNPICFSDGSVSNHHVLDKYGWAWRDPKYKSETELCAMLKWAKEKGLTIEELSI